MHGSAFSPVAGAARGTHTLASVLAFGFGMLALASMPAAATTTVATVLGSANPNLAGALPGTSCCGGDSAPAQTPNAITGFANGSTFTFGVTGVTDGAGTGPTGPDGAYVFSMADYGTGVARALNVKVLGLIGVFLGDNVPTGATQPASLDFASGLDFATLAPGLAQMFWIGDGVTGTGTGATQVFTAPTGATRLFLGTVDGFSWNDNTGTYAVTANYTGAPVAGVPEPATWALLIGGFGFVGGALRRRTAMLAGF